jgi:hypothetical protein
MKPEIIKVLKEIDIVAKEFRLRLGDYGDDDNGGCRVVEWDDDKLVLAVCNEGEGVSVGDSIGRIVTRPVKEADIRFVLPRGVKLADNVRVNLKKNI